MISFDNYKGPVDVKDPAGTIPRSLEGYVPNPHSPWRFAWRRPGPHSLFFALAHALAALPLADADRPPCVQRNAGVRQRALGRHQRVLR